LATVRDAALLVYLPPCSPELNLIEFVWNKLYYSWRRFVTWPRDTFDLELGKLLGGMALNSRSVSCDYLLKMTAVGAAPSNA
jgi:hypothetical protein